MPLLNFRHRTGASPATKSLVRPILSLPLQKTTKKEGTPPKRHSLFYHQMQRERAKMSDNEESSSRLYIRWPALQLSRLILHAASVWKRRTKRGVATNYYKERNLSRSQFLLQSMKKLFRTMNLLTSQNKRI